MCFGSNGLASWLELAFEPSRAHVSACDPNEPSRAEPHSRPSLAELGSFPALAGTCKECYEEASETEEELKLEIEDLRSRLLFLRLPSPTLDASATGHSDLLLHAIP